MSTTPASHSRRFPWIQQCYQLSPGHVPTLPRHLGRRHSPSTRRGPWRLASAQAARHPPQGRRCHQASPQLPSTASEPPPNEPTERKRTTQRHAKGYRRDRTGLFGFVSLRTPVLCKNHWSTCAGPPPHQHFAITWIVIACALAAHSGIPVHPPRGTRHRPIHAGGPHPADFACS